MKVFFVCSWYPNRNRSSEGIFLKNMAEAIAAYDDITVFYVAEDENLVSKTEEVDTNTNGVKTIILYHKPIRLGVKNVDVVFNSIKEIFLLFGLISREFKKSQPDILHLNVVSPKVLVLWYYRLFHSKPFIYSEHWDIPIRVRFGLMKNWLPWRVGMKFCSLFASRVVVCSTAMKDCYRQYKLSTNVDIISNVVEVPDMDFEDEKRLIGKKIMIHISSLDTGQKNVYGMIDGVAKVAGLRSDFELHIIGKGKELNALVDYTRSLRLLDSFVFFHGYVSEEEKSTWIKRSAFHVLFSNFEGQSVVTAESICYGRPVIATHCGGPEDFVNDRDGVLIQPSDIPALINAINYMLDNFEKFSPADLRLYGKEIFSPKVIGERHHVLYQDMKLANISKRSQKLVQ